jgi:hypothetical protein
MKFILFALLAVCLAQGPLYNPPLGTQSTLWNTQQHVSGTYQTIADLYEGGVFIRPGGNVTITSDPVNHRYSILSDIYSQYVYGDGLSYYVIRASPSGVIGQGDFRCFYVTLDWDNEVRRQLGVMKVGYDINNQENIFSGLIDNDLPCATSVPGENDCPASQSFAYRMDSAGVLKQFVVANYLGHAPGVSSNKYTATQIFNFDTHDSLLPEDAFQLPSICMGTIPEFCTIFSQKP